MVNEISAKQARATRPIFGALAAVLLLLGACTSDSGGQAIDTADPVDVGQATTEATAPAASPGATVPATNATTVPAPTPTTAVVTPAAPPCSDVPRFNAADTVAVACAGEYAVSPELFASNAGWHLFRAQGGQWIEIDYDLTCCDPEEVQFTEILTRNGLDESTVTALCAASLAGPDSVTGCSTNADGNADFEPTWLRVNGLGDHDFGATDAAVLATVEQVFGPPESVTEQSECGAGPMTIASFDDFSLNFQAGGLVGWFYTSSVPALTTPSGVASGISEAALIEAYPGVDIGTETLGKEFFFEVPAGFIGGFFTDDGSSVSALFAGTTCFFR